MILNIKKTQDITLDYIKEDTHNGDGDSTHRKWVSVDSLKHWLYSNSFGFRETGINNIDSDELIKELMKEEN